MSSNFVVIAFFVLVDFCFDFVFMLRQSQTNKIIQSDNIEKNLKYINVKTCYTEVLKFACECLQTE